MPSAPTLHHLRVVSDSENLIEPPKGSAKGTTEERRRIIDYFVAGVRINSKEGWAEGEFYEDPALQTTSFCMAPPTGFEPVSRP